MIQLIWAILNIVTFIGLLIFCARSAVEIRNKVGLSVALLFAFFALSFIGRPSNNVNDKIFQFQKTEKKGNLNRATFLSDLLLEEDLMTKIKLNLVCDNENVRTALVDRTGFMCGTEWKTDYITINKTDRKNTYHYHILATRIWKLLGIEIGKEGKDYEGTYEFKPKF